MNAPVRASDLAPLGDAHDFAECCGTDAWFYSNNWISLHTAVDNLQNLAERWGLIEEIGQDAVQAIMVDAFAPREAAEEVDDLPSDYAAQIVRQWEMNDARDRWRHTGEMPPGIVETPSAIRPKVAVPQATVAAFKYVVALGDPEYLARWLRAHSDVAADLVKEVGQC
jgi:hypothetical protein